MGLVREGAGKAHGHLEAEMSIRVRVDELVSTGKYSVDQAIAIAVTEQANHKDSFLAMREAALGGSK